MLLFSGSYLFPPVVNTPFDFAFAEEPCDAGCDTRTRPFDACFVSGFTGSSFGWGEARSVKCGLSGESFPGATLDAPATGCGGAGGGVGS